jgi:hypothetical protein
MPLFAEEGIWVDAIACLNKCPWRAICFDIGLLFAEREDYQVGKA